MRSGRKAVLYKSGIMNDPGFYDFAVCVALLGFDRLWPNPDALIIYEKGIPLEDILYPQVIKTLREKGVVRKFKGPKRARI